MSESTSDLITWARDHAATCERGGCGTQAAKLTALADAAERLEWERDAEIAALRERVRELERERDALIAAWPEREAPTLGQSLIYPATKGYQGRKQFGEHWPDAKRDFVRFEAGLDAMEVDA